MSHPEQHLLNLARAFYAYEEDFVRGSDPTNLLNTELKHGKAYIVIIVKFYLATRHKVVKI